jgi:hypothetical protein
MGALSKLAEPQGQAWDESCAPFRINEQYYPIRSNRFSLDESRLFFYLSILAVQLTAAFLKTTTTIAYCACYATSHLVCASRD